MKSVIFLSHFFCNLFPCFSYKKYNKKGSCNTEVRPSRRNGTLYSNIRNVLNKVVTVLIL